MRYVARFGLFWDPQYLPLDKIAQVLRKHGLDTFVFEQATGPHSTNFVLEKTDPKYASMMAALRELREDQVLAGAVSYEAVFDPGDVRRSELLLLYVRVHCGEATRQPAKGSTQNQQELVIDKRAMKQRDIATTFGHHEIVISERLRWLLQEEALTGWRATPVRHKNPKKDTYPRLYHLVPTNVFPSLAPEMEFHRTRYTNPKNNLFGTEALQQAGPLTYRRSDLIRVQDLNRTTEEFGDEPVKHPYPIISQRAWSVLKKHKIKKVDAEPVVIM